MSMMIYLPRGLCIDAQNGIPEDFDEQIRKCFHDYTEGTRKEYRYYDKLGFIDLCTEKMHECDDPEDAVKQLILKRSKYLLNEYGELADKDEFWSIEWFAECYEEGRKSMELYHSSKKNRRDEMIMKMLLRIMRVVLDYNE